VISPHSTSTLLLGILLTGVLHGQGLELDAGIYGHMTSGCLEQFSSSDPADTALSCPGLTLLSPQHPVTRLSFAAAALTIVSMETIMVSMETTTPARVFVPKLNSHLEYWLRRVSNAVSGEFAEVLGMTRGAISEVVDKVKEKRWVQTQSRPGDNRVHLLPLTHHGRHNLPILGKAADQNVSHFFPCLKPSEWLVLKKLLVKIAEKHQIRDVSTA